MSYDHMWEVIKCYHLKIDLEFPWLCVLCHKLLVDTYEGPCGCVFCKQCIIDYLQDDNKFCPTDNDDCKLMELNFNVNFVKVKSIDKKISELKIQCPLELCDYKTEMMNMFNHIKNCDKRVIFCPYSEVGCPIKAMQNEPMSTHLLVEFNHHNYLLMQRISFFNKQMNEINNEQIIIKNEISHVDNSVRLELSYIKTKLSEENNRIQLSIENLLKEIQSIKSAVSDITNKCNSLEIKFEQWKENFQCSLVRLQDEYINKIKPQRKRKLNKSERVDLDQLNNSINACEYRQKTFSNFTWKIIEGLKMKKTISSENFFTKNNLFIIKLELFHKNKNELAEWDVRIRLLIKYNLIDETIQDGVCLPFDIKLIVKNMRNIFYNLKKSNLFQIKIYKHYYVNVSFGFSFRELEEAGVDPGESILIECKFEVN